MKMKSLLVAASVASVSFSAASASEIKPYVGGGLSYTKSNVKIDSDNFDTTVSKPGVNLSFGIENHFTDKAFFNVEGILVRSFGKKTESEVEVSSNLSYGFLGKIGYDVFENNSVYGILGLMSSTLRMEKAGSDTQTGNTILRPTYGFGYSYQLDKDLKVFAEYVTITEDRASDVDGTLKFKKDILNIGVRKYFN